jgi:predicted Zn-dependent protease
VAGEWLTWIEAQSAKASSPLARSAYDGARLTAAIALGTPGRALPALEASARALPDQFFALSYLARAQLEVGKPKEAAATAAEAARLADGPRKVPILVTEAKALRASGDPAGAARVLDEAIRHGEALPEAVRPKGAITAARKLRAELTAG